MEKSITIICEEFKDDFANLINSSNLPACIIELILENYLREIKLIVRKQYEIDKKQYEDSIKE